MEVHRLNSKRRRILHCLIGLAVILLLLVVALNPNSGADQSPKPVRLSRASGFYDGEFYLEMQCDRGEIRYTLDCTEPDENSLLYTEPILIGDASANPNVYCMNEDISVEMKPDILEMAGKEPTYRFTTPKEPVDKATVIRAVCIDAFGNRSEIIEGVYFVGFDQKKAYDGMNIITITTEPDNLFDYEKGIYVMGKAFGDVLEQNDGIPPVVRYIANWEGNYKNRGKEWEREARVCIFNADRKMVLSGDYGIRIQGGASRYMAMKSFNIFARKRYNSQPFPCDELFGEDWHLDSLNLNAGGQGVYTKIHDVMINTLAKDLDVLTREYEPYQLFLDGEYWGVYWLTPRFKSDYFESKYGIPDGDVIETKVNYIEVGVEEDNTAHKELLQLIADNDLDIPENYERLCEAVDIDSWIDYYAIECYIANYDWPKNNRSMWRSRRIANEPGQDGKWRWILFDVNLAMKLKRAEENYLTRTAKVDAIFSSLYECDLFRKALTERMVTLARDYFSPERVNAYVDDYVERMRNAMANEYSRFYSDRTEEDFVQECEDIKSFFQKRHDYIMEAYGDKQK